MTEDTKALLRACHSYIGSCDATFNGARLLIRIEAALSNESESPGPAAPTVPSQEGSGALVDAPPASQSQAEGDSVWIYRKTAYREANTPPASQQPTPDILTEIKKVRDAIYSATGSAFISGDKCKAGDRMLIYSSLCAANNTLACVEDDVIALRLEVAELKRAAVNTYDSVINESRRRIIAERELAELRGTLAKASTETGAPLQPYGFSKATRVALVAYDKGDDGADWYKRRDVDRHIDAITTAHTAMLAKAGEGLPPPCQRYIEFSGAAGMTCVDTHEYDKLRVTATEQIAAEKASFGIERAAHKDALDQLVAKGAQIAEINALSALRLEMILERERTIAAKDAENAALRKVAEAAKAWLIAYEDEVRNPVEEAPCRNLVAAVDAINAADRARGGTK